MTESNGSGTKGIRVMEDPLTESDLRLRQVIDALPHMVWLATLDGNCTFLSKRWEQYTGIAAAQQLGRRWIAQLHEDDRAQVRAALDDAVATGVELRLNCRIRRFDGMYRWFETRGMPLRDSDGKIVSWFGTNTDVHDAYEARRQLAEKEERLRYVAQATHDAIYDWDMRLGMTYRNDRFEQLFAVPGSEGSGAWWKDRIHPDDYRRVVERANKAFREHQPNWNAEYRLLRPDGTYAVVNDRAYVLYDADLKPIRLIGAIADESARREAEQSLRDAQARLLSAMSAGGLATWIWDVHANVVYWDDAAYRLWGRSSEGAGPLSMEKISSFVHPDDAERTAEVLTRFYRTGIDTPLEFRTVRPDGALQWLYSTGQIERDHTGQPVRVGGVYIDVTERKQIEQTLRDSQDRLRSAMDAGGLATWIWDVRANEVIWDDATCRLWGRAPDEFCRVPVEQVLALIHPDDLKEFMGQSADLRPADMNGPVEFRTVRPDGALQWLLAKGQAQRDASGQVFRMAGVFVDITDRKRNEEIQLRSQKMEALGTLAGGIAHDFNNILLAITGNAKLALTDLQTALPPEHSVQRNLQEIDKAAARAADLVKRILTFSRLEKAEREVLRMQPLIEDSLKLLRPTLRATIEIRTALDTDIPPVASEPIQIQQVVMNLITNAAHAIGDKPGTIDIRLDDCEFHIVRPVTTGQLQAGRYVCLTISDSGGGIDPAVIERIFDPFFTTKPVGQGTGLGLAVVHGIVRTHGGAVGVESHRGCGTTFRVYFPAASGEVKKAEVKAQALPTARGAHVLYVDDEEALVFLIGRVLERMGYRVTGCIDPEQALRELRARPREFDAVVTDLSMRGMNGFELTSEVKTIRSDLPVLLTSGYLRSEDRDLAAQLGIRELILKPNTVEELGQAIDRTLAGLTDDETQPASLRSQ
jgi:PAS domain S-box-containing protein